MNICHETGKQVHAEKHDAMAQLRSLKRCRSNVCDDLEAFRCEHCGGWHLGHHFPTSPRWGRKSLKRRP